MHYRKTLNSTWAYKSFSRKLQCCPYSVWSKYPTVSRSETDHVSCTFIMHNEKWARLLAYVSGLVNQRLLLQCEYLAAENRILRAQLSMRLRLSDRERSTSGRNWQATGP